MEDAGSDLGHSGLAGQGHEVFLRLGQLPIGHFLGSNLLFQFVGAFQDTAL